jgi:transposase
VRSFVCSNGGWLEVRRLPPHSPEFGPTERLKQHLHKNVTRNRHLANAKEFLGAPARVFTDMQNSPGLIRPYLHTLC